MNDDGEPAWTAALEPDLRHGPRGRARHEAGSSGHHRERQAGWICAPKAALAVGNHLAARGVHRSSQLSPTEPTEPIAASSTVVLPERMGSVTRTMPRGALIRGAPASHAGASKPGPTMLGSTPPGRGGGSRRPRRAAPSLRAGRVRGPRRPRAPCGGRPSATSSRVMIPTRVTAAALRSGGPSASPGAPPTRWRGRAAPSSGSRWMSEARISTAQCRTAAAAATSRGRSMSRASVSPGWPPRPPDRDRA